MIEKPPYGAECNGCGGCCEDQLCPLASIKFPNWRAPCPALAKNAAGVKTCDLINDPTRFVPVLGVMVGREALSKGAAILCGAGLGCDALKPGEVAAPETSKRMRAAAMRAYSKTEIKEAKRNWGIR